MSIRWLAMPRRRIGNSLARLVVLGLLALPSSASATEYTIDSLADPGDGTCATSTCTLRDAILDANANPGSDYIHAQVPGRIVLASPLPTITGSLAISGENAPGFTPTMPVVGLDLSAIGTATGLDFNGVGASAVDGLAIHGAPNGVGVAFRGGTVNSGIDQSWLGIDLNGNADPLDVGVRLANTTSNLIGGNGFGNRFAGTNTALDLVSADALVQGNTFGVLPDGTTPAPNSSGIVAVGGTTLTIGGANAGDGNVFGESFGNSVAVSDVTGSVTIARNRLGVAADGVTPTPGGPPGEVSIDNTTPHLGAHTIGGSSPSDANVMAGTDLVVIDRDATDDLVVRNNRITGAHFAIGGITVGTRGTALVADNAVTGGAEAGIYLRPLDAAARVTVVRNTVASNAKGGVRVESDAPNHVVIGGAPADANTIRANGQVGIGASGPGMISWRRNVITANDGLGIDMGDPGVNPQDGGGSTNGGQNAPLVSLAEQRGGTLHVEGTIKDAPFGTTEIDLYRNAACDPSGTGEAESFLGTVTVNAVNGTRPFAADLNATLLAGEQVAAISTDVQAGASSELSACRAVTSPTAAATDGTAPGESAPAASPAPGESPVRTTLALVGLPATVGRVLTHRLTLRNPSGQLATGTTAILDLPAGTAAVAARIVRPASTRQATTALRCTTAGRRMSCPAGDLGPGASRTIEIDARPGSAGAYRAAAAADQSGGGRPGPGSAAETQALTTPEPAETANLAPVRGTVLIRLPGARRFVDLRASRQVPIGTTIDTRRGRVSLITAADRRGATRQADFYEGLFRVRQPASAAITDIRLVEPLATCARYGGAQAAARKRRARHVWGSGGGGHRTTGQRAAATVRGTIWLVEDRCDGSTRVRVRKGSVRVKVAGRKRTLVLPAPRSYVARPRR